MAHGEERMGDDRSGWTSTEVGPAGGTRWDEGGGTGGVVAMDGGVVSRLSRAVEGAEE